MRERIHGSELSLSTVAAEKEGRNGGAPNESRLHLTPYNTHIHNGHSKGRTLNSVYISAGLLGLYPPPRVEKRPHVPLAR